MKETFFTPMEDEDTVTASAYDPEDYRTTAAVERLEELGQVDDVNQIYAVANKYQDADLGYITNTYAPDPMDVWIAIEEYEEELDGQN